VKLASTLIRLRRKSTARQPQSEQLADAKPAERGRDEDRRVGLVLRRRDERVYVGRLEKVGALERPPRPDTTRTLDLSDRVHSDPVNLA
jgi:hypothetical protein